jgi:hypothetical protein
MPVALLFARVSLVTALGAASLFATACAGPPPPLPCEAFLLCQDAVDAMSGTSVVEDLAPTFGSCGTCWTTTTEAACACETACLEAMDSLAEAFPGLPACQATFDDQGRRCGDVASHALACSVRIDLRPTDRRAPTFD